MHVRPLRPADRESAGALLRQLGYPAPAHELAEGIRLVLAAATHYAAVAEAEGRVVGLVHAYARPALARPFEAVVESLVVEPGARRQGAATLLMASVEAWAREKGFRLLALHTRVDREDACAFYERSGFRRTATAHRYSKDLGESPPPV
jgi:ribosomal protein S18 acetylase RimI-like enzyme